MAYKEGYEKLLAAVITHLWFGRVGEAITSLQSREEGVKDLKAWKAVQGYLKNRWPYITNYQERHSAKLWIANTRVEKLNEWGRGARPHNNAGKPARNSKVNLSLPNRNSLNYRNEWA